MISMILPLMFAVPGVAGNCAATRRWQGATTTGTNVATGADPPADVGSNSRRQRNSWLEWIPCRRATSETEAPATSISPTIARFCSPLQRRRVVATTSNWAGVVLGPDIVLSPLQFVTNGANRGCLPRTAPGVLHRRHTLDFSQCVENAQRLSTSPWPGARRKSSKHPDAQDRIKQRHWALVPI